MDASCRRSLGEDEDRVWKPEREASRRAGETGEVVVGSGERHDDRAQDQQE
eukprot:CAMPEP_0196735016 /NCGR_PEP_ID=MMETSP1091-20130531/13591_1 /TAXON_ID=302021 /ORGANISM="Rhodomonas sp., Strain CCMP768" /LENGTH=50 /DNA_ID=CAMNT_0042078609 /DNA_START=85 /DNA_END=234 /DNA_ORIENTATION=-